MTAGGDILVGADGFSGLQRVSATRATSKRGGWTTEEVRWTTTGLKPFFNDFVAHEGHAYGFDGSILASVDLETGERAWKGGRYGHGQLLLLADQDLLLVLSERGDLALVDATPTGFTERAPAIEGKTWNHSVLVDDILVGAQRRRDGGVSALPPNRRAGHRSRSLIPPPCGASSVIVCFRARCRACATSTTRSAGPPPINGFRLYGRNVTLMVIRVFSGPLHASMNLCRMHAA